MAAYHHACTEGTDHELAQAAKALHKNELDSPTEMQGHRCTVGDASVLTLAAWHNRAEAIEILVGRGANVDQEDESGWTPMFMALFHGNLAAALKLLELGAALDNEHLMHHDGDLDVGWYPLELALNMEGSYKLVNALLAAGYRTKQRHTRRRLREAIFTKFMRDLALELGQLPLVQLLMAEFALQPCNVGTTGQMRFRFLALYAQTCHTVHADAAEGVAGLPALAWVLRTHKPARELLTKKLHAAKALGAQWSSGGHKLGKIIAMPEQTLMQMRIEIFELQQKPGRIAGELSGNSEECELIVQSMANGKSYTFEFRRALHIHRHFSCNGSVLSYANTTQSAISGALIFLKNYLKDDLPPVMSRSTMTRHDQRFDWVQRLLGCRELQEAFSPLSALWDDASQRGVSFLGVALLGLRLDDSCYYEVMRIARLKRDLEGTAKTGKNGKNIARQLMFAFQHHMGAAARDMLWQLGVMLIDSTAGNSGPKITNMHRCR